MPSDMMLCVISYWVLSGAPQAADSAAKLLRTHPAKEQVKEKARDSVLQLLSRLQAEQTQRKPGEPDLAEKSKIHFQ